MRNAKWIRRGIFFSVYANAQLQFFGVSRCPTIDFWPYIAILKTYYSPIRPLTTALDGGCRNSGRQPNRHWQKPVASNWACSFSNSSSLSLSRRRQNVISSRTVRQAGCHFRRAWWNFSSPSIGNERRRQLGLADRDRPGPARSGLVRPGLRPAAGNELKGWRTDGWSDRNRRLVNFASQ